MPTELHPHHIVLDRQHHEPPIMAELVERPSRGPWLAGLVVCLMVAAVVYVLGVWHVPRELQRWRLAAAEEKRLDGDLAGALAQLHRELEANPADTDVRLKRLEWLTEDRQFATALKEITAFITDNPEDVRGYQLRAAVHQGSGEFSRAVEDWKQILALDSVGLGSARAVALNGLAYAQSLANIEIDDGLAKVDAAMRLQGESYAMLDTRGFLYYRQGDWNRALTDLDHAVAFAEAEYARSTVASPVIADRRLKRELDRRQSQSLAVIRYHRALLHEQRQDREQAEADLQRVRELGFEPDESLF